MVDRKWLAVEIGAARAALCETLASVRPEQWEMPSLCYGWSVRDVVGHLLHQYGMYRNPLRPLEVIRYGGRIHRFLAEAGRREAAGRDFPELVAALRSANYERTRTWRIHPWPQLALGEFVIHGQDIRRPLGLEDPSTTDQRIVAANIFAERPGFAALQKKLPQVRFEATDVDWTHGSGPVVRGPLGSVVMVLAGRRAFLDEVDGDGVALLERSLR